MIHRGSSIHSAGLETEDNQLRDQEKAWAVTWKDSAS